MRVPKQRTESRSSPSGRLLGGMFTFLIALIGLTVLLVAINPFDVTTAAGQLFVVAFALPCSIWIAWQPK
ncbi:hypothetical protein SH668x_002915 [Planctomicrobium sp. SH668]|uniref:hypothetical protein n=1 Tax=Planctomicrobium sp. SH668 TaxID=3448126 RepID=UPI003F5CB5CD